MTTDKQKAINDIVLEMLSIANKYANKVKRQKPTKRNSTNIKRTMQAFSIAIQIRQLAIQIQMIKSQPDIPPQIAGVFNK